MDRGALCALILITLLPGCAPIETQVKKLDEARSCCKSPREFRYLDLAQEPEAEFELTDQSPAFDFPTGKSFFQGLKLPADHQAWRIKVRTDLRGMSSLGGQFCPSLTLLDRNFAHIETKYVQPIWQAPGLTERGYFYAQYVSVGPGVAYIVVHMDRRNADGKLMLVSGGGGSIILPFGTALLAVSDGPVSVTHSPCAPVGRLAVSVSPEPQ